MTLNLDEIEARANAATKGPWQNDPSAGWPVATISTGCSNEKDKDCFVFTAPMHGSDIGESDAYPDAVFIAHARTDIPNLIQAVRELSEALRFYTDSDSYKFTRSFVWRESLVYLDRGKTANSVLEKWGLK